MSDQAENVRKLLAENALLQKKIAELEELAALHRRAEGEIRKRDAQYQQLVAHAPDGIFTIDGEGRFLFVNAAFCRMLGVGPDECLKLNILDTYPDTSMPDGLKRLADLQCGEALRFERPLRRQNGSIIIVSANAWKDPDGNLRAIVRDITERKRMEEALRRSEEKYRNILENIDDGYYEIDLAGNFTLVNDEISRHLLYTREELIGMNGRRYMDEETFQALTRHYLELYRTGKRIQKYAFEIIRKDGTRGFSEISVALIRDDRGNPIGFRGISRDVTERRQMEERIRQSEERYRTIIEQIEDGYFETDLRGHLTFVNEAECRNLGYSREEIIGMNHHQYADEKNAALLFNLFYGVYKTGIPVRAQAIELIKKDGARHFDEISVALIRNAKGEPTGFRGIARDITERKQLEEKLRVISITDELTGLYNRRGFIAFSEQHRKIAVRTRQAMLLFFADLDKLKEINDTFGHQEGDRALVEVAEILKSAFRESDVIGRIGGDEFAVLVTNATAAAGGLLSARVQEILDRRNQGQSRGYPLGLSKGVAPYDPDHPCSLDELMSRADERMYRQKTNKLSDR
ncbi:MAG: PAS domain S-box protein [Syntrophaceae bacterium]|jgi:diguanylate cyclase (GGDEF)-like protein/PAS domain S-box-containing protein|nr:PAS domain S-box protein [Syntrophaceae bacterium]